MLHQHAVITITSRSCCCQTPSSHALPPSQPQVSSSCRDLLGGLQGRPYDAEFAPLDVSREEGPGETAGRVLCVCVCVSCAWGGVQGGQRNPHGLASHHTTLYHASPGAGAAGCDAGLLVPYLLPPACKIDPLLLLACLLPPPPPPRTCTYLRLYQQRSSSIGRRRRPAAGRRAGWCRRVPPHPHQEQKRDGSSHPSGDTPPSTSSSSSHPLLSKEGGRRKDGGRLGALALQLQQEQEVARWSIKVRSLSCMCSSSSTTNTTTNTNTTCLLDMF